MIIKQTHTVSMEIEAQHFVDYIANHFPVVSSRNGAKKAIKRGELLLNGEIVETGTWIKGGEQILFVDPQVNPPKPYKLDLDVVYEDDSIAIINKPPGIEVSGNKFKTIENALSVNLQVSNELDALPWARPVHRLDYPTSGLLLVAKTKSAQISLGRQFEKKKIHKRYRAVVIGELPEKGEMRTPVNGLASSSDFSLVKIVDSLKSIKLSLVDLFPHTGRTHQLRVHLADLGFPILGDSLYGKEGMILKSKGMFLAAVEIRFIHPKTEKFFKLDIEQPAKFTTYLEREARRFLNYNT